MTSRILIAENDKSLSRDYHRYIDRIDKEEREKLRMDAFEIVEASCADHAKNELRKAQQENNPFDILLLDLRMPNQPSDTEEGDAQNGLAVLGLAQKLRMAREIVVVSQYLDEPAHVIEAVRSGAAD